MVGCWVVGCWCGVVVVWVGEEVRAMLFVMQHTPLALVGRVLGSSVRCSARLLRVLFMDCLLLKVTVHVSVRRSALLLMVL